MGKVKDAADAGEYDPTSDIDVDTLSGDVRDALLTHLRSMPKAWGGLNEREQRDRIYAVEQAAKSLVRQVVHAVAERGFDHVEATIGKITVDKGVELKLTCANTLDNVTKLAAHGKMGAVLVLSEVSEFLGERAPAKVDKDEPALIPEAAE